MSEWTDEDQKHMIQWCSPFVMPEDYAKRALACVRLCAGHADLTKCEVVSAGIGEMYEQTISDLGKAKAELATLREQLSAARSHAEGWRDAVMRIGCMLDFNGIGGVDDVLASAAERRDANVIAKTNLQLEAEKLREQLAAREAAAAFGRAVFSEFWNEGDPGALDGGQLQELAATYGMLSKHPVPEGGCGECCNCVGSGADTGDDCYRPTEAAIARQEGGANG